MRLNMRQVEGVRKDNAYKSHKALRRLIRLSHTTISGFLFGLLAQLVERRPVKAKVAGSSPAGTANMVSSSSG